MASWRDIKRKALGQVHKTFELPAVYLSHAGGSPVAVNVRLHRKNERSNLRGEDFTDGADFLVLRDRIVFPPGFEALTDAYVIFGTTEAYVTGPNAPAREGYTTTDVTPLPQTELDLLLAAVDTTGDVWAAILP